MAMRMRVVPVSTMPAVEDRMFVDVPYLMDWSMPKKSEAGDVRVRGLQSGGRHLNTSAGGRRQRDPNSTTTRWARTQS